LKATIHLENNPQRLNQAPGAKGKGND